MSDLASLITKAKSGQLDTLAALIEAMARDLRAFIATYATSLAMADEVHTATWIQVRKELSNCPPNAQGITWVRQRAIGMLRNLLDAERSSAIAARDGLRHLIAQDGVEGLEALVSPSNEGAALLSQRYAALDDASQLLISRRYADRATLSKLAGEAGTSDSDVAKRLFTARAGLHWRSTDADKRPPDDPHLAVAIDQHLAGQLDAPGRQNLGTTLMKDLGRAAAFTRQVRIDLMLHAVFGTYSSEQARELATVLVKVEHKRRNESSLLQVVAPPRTPVGSGTELRMANDRIAERQTGTPGSGAAVTASTKAVPRTTRAVPNRRGSSDENLLNRERSRGRSRSNPQIYIIAGAVAAVGLIALVLMWNRGGTPAVEGSPHSTNGQVATVITAAGGSQFTSGRPLSSGAAISAGQGVENTRGETIIEVGGSNRLELGLNTLIGSFDELPDHTGQVKLDKGTLRVDARAAPGVEVRTAHARISFGVGRGTISCESDRTLVHAQAGSVTVVGADGTGTMQVPTDQRVEILAGAAPRVMQAASFVRGINLGGNAVTIDRRRWLSHREALSAGFSLNPSTNIAPPSALSGAGLDFDRKSMLDTGVIGAAGSPVQFSQVVPNGSYQVTLWLANTANLDIERMGVAVNDQQVPLAGLLLKRESWAQLGPLPARATDGKLSISIAGHGAARVSGFALEAPGGDKLALPAGVSVIAPIDGATFYSTEKVTLRAEVVGTVKSVQFTVDDKVLGEVTKEPYHLALDKLPPGELRIIAKAVNLGGELSKSLPLAITVLPSYGTGTILIQRWTGIPGDKLDSVNGNSKLSGPPQQSVEAKEFATQLNWGQQYYCRMRGYVHPPITGDYTFWMVSDDEGELLLSTSADPAQAQRIAYSPNATREREWTKEPSQQSKPIPLIAGQKYYIELRYKEHEGDDWGACGWKLPNGIMDRPIAGAHLSPFKP